MCPSYNPEQNTATETLAYLVSLLITFTSAFLIFFCCLLYQGIPTKLRCSLK